MICSGTTEGKGTLLNTGKSPPGISNVNPSGGVVSSEVDRYKPQSLLPGFKSGERKLPMKNGGSLYGIRKVSMSSEMSLQVREKSQIQLLLDMRIQMVKSSD